MIDISEKIDRRQPPRSLQEPIQRQPALPVPQSDLWPSRQDLQAAVMPCSVPQVQKPESRPDTQNTIASASVPAEKRDESQLTGFKVGLVILGVTSLVLCGVICHLVRTLRKMKLSREGHSNPHEGELIK